MWPFRNSERIRQQQPAEGGIIVGEHRGEYVMLDGHRLVVLEAPCRAGKSTGVVVPTLLSYRESVVVLGRHREHFKLTAGFRHRLGQDVFLFDPLDEEGRTHRYNPLGPLVLAAALNCGEIEAPLWRLARTIFPTDEDGEQFWRKRATNLFIGLVHYLIDVHAARVAADMDAPDLPVTIGEIRRQGLDHHLQVAEYLRRAVAHGTSRGWLSEPCLAALHDFLGLSEQEQRCVLMTFHAGLLDWADPRVDLATSVCDFSLSDLRRRPMSLYIGMSVRRPDHMAVRLLVSQTIDVNMQVPPCEDSTLVRECLLVFDDLTALGRCPGVLDAPQMGRVNLRMLAVIQDERQLKAVYGESAATTLCACGDRVLLGGTRLLNDGEHVPRVGAVVRALDRQIDGVVVLRAHGDERPDLIGAKKLRYFADPLLLARVLPAPVVPALDVSGVAPRRGPLPVIDRRDDSIVKAVPNASGWVLRPEYKLQVVEITQSFADLESLMEPRESDIPTGQRLDLDDWNRVKGPLSELKARRGSVLSDLDLELESALREFAVVSKDAPVTASSSRRIWLHALKLRQQARQIAVRRDALLRAIDLEHDAALRDLDRLLSRFATGSGDASLVSEADPS